ncbi:hypothetical protein GCM10027187_31580 [Streptosporangium sandarakinum]
MSGNGRITSIQPERRRAPKRSCRSTADPAGGRLGVSFETIPELVKTSFQAPGYGFAGRGAPEPARWARLLGDPRSPREPPVRESFIPRVSAPA